MIKNKNIELRDRIRKWLMDTPYMEFHKEIEKRVTGQEDLRTVTTIVYHYLECIENQRPVKCNTILSAPSGCGKTETYRALRDYFRINIPDLPVYIYDASQLTAVGYKGAEPADVLYPFFQNGIRKAIGICFLDELDKKLMPSYSSEGIDTNAEVQGALLTIIEGGELRNKTGIIVDTENIMFMGLGSFDQFRTERDKKKSPIGIFSEEEKKATENEHKHYAPINREDMIKAGGSHELLGRFPYIINYHELDEDAIIRVINIIATTTAESFDCGLTIEDEMMDELIASANSEFGCRLIESKLRDAVIRAYSKAIEEDHEGKILEITAKSMDNVYGTWRNPTEDEIEEDRLASQENEFFNFDSIWDDNTPNSIDDITSVI